MKPQSNAVIKPTYKLTALKKKEVITVIILIETSVSASWAGVLKNYKVESGWSFSTKQHNVLKQNLKKIIK